MTRHTLYEIDLERKSAFCTACGYTEIHVVKSRTKRPTRVLCISRYRELSKESSEYGRERRRLKPPGKPRHCLSQIDTEKRTAVCSVCGPTDIWKDTRKGSIRYLCAKKSRAYWRNNRPSKYASRVANSRRHTLTEINEENKTAVCSLCGPVEIYVWQGEKNIGRRCSNASVIGVPGAQKVRGEINTTLIYKYKADHGCKRCGHNKNLLKLFLYRRDQKKKELKIERLLKLARKDLMQELQRCEVFCLDCRRFRNYELVLETKNTSLITGSHPKTTTGLHPVRSVNDGSAESFIAISHS